MQGTVIILAAIFFVGLILFLIVIGCLNSTLIYFLAFGIGLCCLALLHDLMVFVKERKNKIFLENLFLSVARDYLKNKYNEDIEPYCVKMNFYQDFVAKTYINSGVVYLDEKMSEYVKISFNLTFSSLNIRDNLTIKREDELIRKLKTIAEEVEHTT